MAGFNNEKSENLGFIIIEGPEVVSCIKCDFIFKSFSDSHGHNCMWEKLKSKIKNKVYV